MEFRLDDGSETESFLREWVATDHRHQQTAQRLEAIEEMISYWVPISQERDLRIETIEQRLARLEHERIPPDYSCVAELAARVGALEATLWELSRRLGLKS